MDKLPDACRDCAEYGSDFCQDCLDEITENLSTDEKQNFDHSINAVKELFDAAKKIDNSL